MRLGFPRPALRLLVAAILILSSCGGGARPADPLVIRTVADLPYANLPGIDIALTSLDVTYVEGRTGSPILLYVHGGAWAIGDKANVHLKADHFARAGYVFVSTNYRLYPDAAFPAYAEDVAAATRWVRDEIGAYGGDGARITLMGHSAGAHLVALVSTDSRYLAAEGMVHLDLEAVVALDTQAYDLVDLAALNGGTLPLLYTFIFGTDPVGWAVASPITYVAPAQGIAPTVIAYSGQVSAAQDLVRRLSSERFATALDGAGVRMELVPAPEKTHEQINTEFGAHGNAVTEAVMAFLAGV